jgi:2-oxoglutarate dehydrogenase E2 component (dihydrolipoamide succinyltransferase)
MPQLGETVVEGTILKWLKKEGDQIELDEPLFEISTDKVDTEVPSPVAGVLKEIKVQEGETVEVGAELALVEESGDGQVKPAKAEDEPEEAEQAEEEQEKEEPAKETPPEQPEETREVPREEPETEARVSRGPSADGPRSHILSPLVRRLAEEHGVDLAQVKGSGTGGRITKRDVLAVAEGGTGRPALRAVPSEEAAPAPVPQAEAQPGDREEVVPMGHIRKRIAENMAAVLQSTARAWNLVEVNMESIVRLRTRAKDTFKEREGFSLTYMPFVARAVCDALLTYRDVNARLNLDEGSITYRRYVNLGIAVSYEDGLIVPVLRDAEQMNLVGLARGINDIAARARSKKLKPDEVHGGTFTITNPGPFGSIISVPIMNPGETAILAFDAIEKRPVVEGDAIAVRHMVYLSMSWDHRTIDGAVAAQFLGRLKENLESWDFTPEVQAYLPTGE